MAWAMIDQLEHHFILFSLIFLLIGFMLGQQLRMNYWFPKEEKEESFVKKHTKNKKLDKNEENHTINIDTSTHVVSIKTDNLEKKYEEITEKVKTDENISSSINKLKSLKK